MPHAFMATCQYPIYSFFQVTYQVTVPTTWLQCVRNQYRLLWHPVQPIIIGNITGYMEILNTERHLPNKALQLGWMIPLGRR